MPPRHSLRSEERTKLYHDLGILTRERSEQIEHNESVLKIAIRLVLIRLGFNHDVRDLIMPMCIPNGTIENPFVLD